MKDRIFLLAPFSTLALSAAFLGGSGAASKTVYAPVAGEVWSMRQAEPVEAAPTQTIAVSSAVVVVALSAPTPTTQPAKLHTRSVHRVASRAAANVTRAVSAEALPAAAAVAASTVASQAPVAPKAVTSAPPDYALEDIADRFENDESKFPLDRSTEVGGVALRLVGLEKLPAMYVIKIAVVNSTGTDFFVKAFGVIAGGQILSSRPIFRILVEPQRTREGYVIFEKPLAGASVRINLKEDGGKGRSLETAIPYPF